MKREIKITELAAYLPYATQIISDYDRATTVLDGKMLTEKHYNKYFNVLGYKPILRPLKEAIVPYDLIQTGTDGYKEPNDLLVDENGMVAMDFQAGGATISWPIYNMQLFMQELFEQHFDVYGLIDAGLAIDVNTLTPTSNDSI